MLEYIKYRQKLLERERQRAAELEAKEEAARVAKMEAEARLQEEIAERKRLLLAQQEADRLQQRHIERKEKLEEQKWNNQLNILLSQIEKDSQRDNKLEEIRIIIQNREPSLQELDWASWLANPLNQQLAYLDIEHAMELFKRDNLMAKRRKGGFGGRKLGNFALAFSGDGASSSDDHVTTDFNPDDYNLNLGFTVSYWVRADSVGTTKFAFGRKHNNSQRFTFGISKANKIYIGVGSNKMEGTWSGNLDDNPSGLTAAELFPSLFDGGDLKKGNWLHFAVTYADRASTDEGSVARKTYLNGELIQQANINWNNTGGGTGGITFGGRRTASKQYDNGWACALDEVAIYDTAKDSSWVAEVYNKETSYDHRDQSGLVGYWKFDEPGKTTVTDYSGNGNHGTFAAISGDTTAFPTWELR